MALASHSTGLGDFNPQISRGYDESSTPRRRAYRYELSHPGRLV